MKMGRQVMLEKLLINRLFLCLVVFVLLLTFTISELFDTIISKVNALTFENIQNKLGVQFSTFSLLAQERTVQGQLDTSILPRVVKITDGVYSAIGYGPSNINMIVGDNESVIIDTGSSIENARSALNEFRKISNEPISAIIYTNSNPDHIWGAEVFVEEGRKNNLTVDIISQASVLQKVNTFQVAAKQKSMSNLFWTGALLPSNSSDDPSSNEFEADLKLGNISFVKPTLLFDEMLSTSYGGLNITLLHFPAQSIDNIVVWLPDKGVLLPGDSIYKAFPAFYNMRSNTDTDILKWISGLDKMRAINATYLLPAHSLPVVGMENVTDVLTTYREGISYVFQQTIRYINKGYSPEEIIQFVKLPQGLKEHPWLQERNGHIAWQIRYIYDQVIGWNTGDSTWFDPVTQQERGTRIIEGFGGLNNTINKTKLAFTKGEYSWAAELATYVLYAYPDNQEARALKAQALRNIGEQDQSFGARNWYLTQADLLEGKINRSSTSNQSKTNLQEQVISRIPVTTLLGQMQYKLDPAKSNDTDMVFGIYLNDSGEGYTLHVRNSIVYYENTFPERYDVAIATDTDTLKEILLGRLRFADSVESQKLTVYGNPVDLLKFAGLFDLKFVVPIFRDISTN